MQTTATELVIDLLDEFLDCCLKEGRCDETSSERIRRIRAARVALVAQPVLPASTPVNIHSFQLLLPEPPAAWGYRRILIAASLVMYWKAGLTNDEFVSDYPELAAEMEGIFKPLFANAANTPAPHYSLTYHITAEGAVMDDGGAFIGKIYEGGK